ncbi:MULTISPECIES: M23 family metallopeptidase [unclassified Fibrobacter]|uniref:M23 family metallopeptidase n=1 Tax=unclassified Fibrobacter TaxID=2634177 RepID=UPI000D6D2702|nr:MULTISPECIES: M23 family metallopeptidase [unclassified Fibrobacter]PWJ61606.1 peptidase M23-like protein [Fibrobacter sp. UWR4]PZW73996.1 peptidase M23-like protein [Fibrobacter sp. UWR1]
MAVEFQEYKGKRKPINTQHKFPLLRLLIVAIAAFAVYWSGLPTKIANALPLPGNEPEVVVETWDSRCVAVGGEAVTVNDSIGQCSWQLSENDSLLLPDPFLRYLSSRRKISDPKLYWYAKTTDFASPLVVLYDNGTREGYYHMMKKDSSYVWVKDNGCRFPGVCPHMPLEWSALSITEGFDFEGQESLIAMDVFRGIGEAPIHAVLPGRVLDLGKDTLGYFVEIDHGNNISSRTSGMGLRADSLKVGDSVKVDVPVGRIAPMDSSEFYLSVRENGRFVRWKDFYAEAYPFTAEDVSTFVRRFK